MKLKVYIIKYEVLVKKRLLFNTSKMLTILDKEYLFYIINIRLYLIFDKYLIN
jgi:hypothetical protein